MTSHDEAQQLRLRIAELERQRDEPEAASNRIFYRKLSHELQILKTQLLRFEPTSPVKSVAPPPSEDVVAARGTSTLEALSNEAQGRATISATSADVVGAGPSIATIGASFLDPEVQTATPRPDAQFTESLSGTAARDSTLDSGSAAVLHFPLSFLENSTTEVTVEIEEARPRSYDAFLCFAPSDCEPLQTELIEPLKAAGVNVWYHARRDWPTGQALATTVRALNASRWFLCAVSIHAQNCEWVLRAVDWALEHRQERIVPVLLHEYDEGSNLFHRLKLLPYLDLTRDPDGARAKLVASLRSSK